MRVIYLNLLAISDRISDFYDHKFWYIHKISPVRRRLKQKSVHFVDFNGGRKSLMYHSVIDWTLPYFIKYNGHTSIVRNWISLWFLAKKLFLFLKNNFKRNNHCKFIHHKSHLKPILSYLPCIVCREYFSIIFDVKSAHYTWKNAVN